MDVGTEILEKIRETLRIDERALVRRPVAGDNYLDRLTTTILAG